jgi:hypothetical protein
MRLSGALAGQAHGGGSVAGGPLAAAQQRFYQACRYAELALATNPADSADAVRLKTLREQNKELAQRLGFERARADAERQVRAGLSVADTDGAASQQDDPLPDQGAPLFGQGYPGDSPPRVQLQSAGLLQARCNLALSLVLLCVLAVIGVLSYFPRAMPWVRRFWPEQMALLAALIWLMAGPVVVTALLLCFAVAGRFLEVGALVYRHMQRATAIPPAAAPSSAS